MAPSPRCELILLRVLLPLLALAGCGALPPDASPAPPVAADVVAGSWQITGHVLAARSSLTDADARELHGRTLTVGAGYTTPWQGSCEAAGRQRRSRPLADVTTALELGAAGHAEVVRFGLAATVAEVTLGCSDPPPKAPPVTLYVAGLRAVTCYSGVCYLLAK